MFCNVLIKKKLNLSSKKSIYQRPKICIFPKRLDHGFCQKISLFPYFVLMQNRAVKVLCNVLKEKQA